MPHKKVWIEIETSKGGSDTYIFSGQIDSEEMSRLIQGRMERPYIKLENVFWYRYENDEEKWRSAGKHLFKYGEGDYMSYTGEMYFHKDSVLNISALKYGPDEIPDGI